jgi:hypothetical protein
MKTRTFLMSLLFAGMTLPANAQFQYGFKAGLTSGVLSYSGSVNSPYLETHGYLGALAGPMVKWVSPVKGLGADASLLYDLRVATTRLNMVPGTSDRTVRQHQIALPVNVRYDVSLAKGFGLLFFAGPQFGVNVGNREIDIKHAIWTLHRFQLSANVGMGFMIANHFQLSVNYNIACTRSASNITPFDSGPRVKDYSRFHAWQFSLAYFL